MIGPLRKVFRKTADGEEGPFDLLAIKAGETFRMEPPDNCFDPGCPTKWMESKTDGYLREDGGQGIVIWRFIEVEATKKEPTCKID